MYDVLNCLESPHRTMFIHELPYGPNTPLPSSWGLELKTGRTKLLFHVVSTTLINENDLDAWLPGNSVGQYGYIQLYDSDFHYHNVSTDPFDATQRWDDGTFGVGQVTSSCGVSLKKVDAEDYQWGFSMCFDFYIQRLPTSGKMYFAYYVDQCQQAFLNKLTTVIEWSRLRYEFWPLV